MGGQHRREARPEQRIALSGLVHPARDPEERLGTAHRLADRRYSQLRKLTSGISDKMLTQRLNELVHADLIRRHGAHYEMTPDGMELAPALDALYRWGERVAREHEVELGPTG